MMSIRNFLIALLCLWSGLIGQIWAAPPVLYAVTRATRAYRHPGISHPAAGLFVTHDKGETWDHLGWPYGKFFSVSARRLTDGEILLCQACGNGVLISDNSGASWRIATGWEITECLKTAIHPTDPRIIYTATAYGIYKSTDGGQTWSQRNRGLISTFTSALLIDPDNAQLLFCATEAGVHRSQNAGESWKPIGLLGKGIRTLHQHPQNSAILVAGTENDGLFMSTDRGKSWQAVNRGLHHPTIYAFCFVPGEPQTLFCGTYRGGVYRSRDLGQTWKAVNKGLPSCSVHAMTADPQDPQTLYAGTLGFGVWRSRDGGDSWEFSGLQNSEVWDFHWLADQSFTAQP
jgi:photosystem II stability/assembly factor-like uncharacterized protein